MAIILGTLFKLEIINVIKENSKRKFSDRELDNISEAMIKLILKKEDRIYRLKQTLINQH